VILDRNLISEIPGHGVAVAIDSIDLPHPEINAETAGEQNRKTDKSAG
jgi:hypothetical protein